MAKPRNKPQEDPSPKEPCQKKTWHVKDMEPLSAKTDAQKTALRAMNEKEGVALIGSAGTGKTYLAVRYAIECMLNGAVDHVVFVRSMVSTRDPGFLKGSLDEKQAPYEQVFIDTLHDLFGRRNTYRDMVAARKVSFEPTSFLRGRTLSKCVVVADEVQNMTFQELDTLITRIGASSQLILVGDTAQNDMPGNKETSGLPNALPILNRIKDFAVVTFEAKDNVRQGLSKSWLLAKEAQQCGLSQEPA